MAKMAQPLPDDSENLKLGLDRLKTFKKSHFKTWITQRFDLNKVVVELARSNSARYSNHASGK